MLIVASGVFAASTIGFAVAWMRARERSIRAEQGVTPMTADTSRFDRLEVAVDTIALEVERMAEGQRFLTRVLADRTERESMASR